MQDSQSGISTRTRSGILWMLLLTLGILASFFGRSLDPSLVIFSNDGPVGATSMAALQLPAAYFGFWYDLNWLGVPSGNIPADIYYLLFWLFGPIGSAKFVLPITLLFLALSAWLFFRRAGFGPTASIFGALAAMLNSGVFSDGAWGLMTHTITVGMNFLALAALTGSRGSYWIRLVLAGFAVGIGVVESPDIGALYSLVIAVWVIYQGWIETEGSAAKRLATGSGRLVVVGICAGLIAFQTVVTMVGTQITGIVGTGQDQQSKVEKWDWATQWSLPKKEAIGLAAPGVFGYRMDTLGGGQYWGEIGQTPGWSEHHQGFPRYSGTGYYVGILVILLAMWATLNAFQRQTSVFTLIERRWIWFWLGVFIVSLLLAFGRHAPFYQIVYALPYFSTIRNPTKFLFFVGWAMPVLAAFGVEGLLRACVAKSAKPAAGQQHFVFEKRWTFVALAFGALGVIGWLVYSGSSASLERHLQSIGFGAVDAASIAQFSIRQAGVAVFFLLLSLGVLWAVTRGKLFAGRRNWSGIILIGVLVADLFRANLPWVKYWDYEYKYASNSVIDFLKDKPYEQRVARLPFRSPPQFAIFDQMYGIEWAQHHFYYYDIQSLDIVQMSREPVVFREFEGALRFDGTSNTISRVTRRWELTNTRYLLGPVGFQEVLNTQLDSQKQRFRTALRFNIERKPEALAVDGTEDFTAVTNANGDYAVFEFTGALPRAGLYAKWEVSTNDQATLGTLVDPAFNPAETVLVAQATQSAPGTNTVAGTVEFKSYAPTHIVLNADAKTPCVLLLNDRYDPDWKVVVDGKPARLLRCNFIMRGVELAPGTHTIEFLFRPSLKAFYFSAVVMIVGVLLAGMLVISGRRRPKA
jgi:hypothetical protein